MKHSLRLLLVAVSATVVASCRQQVSESVARPSSSAACQAALAPGGHAQPIDRTIDALQERARRSPSKRDALEQLGYQFVARARAANDPGDYILAERVATCLDVRYAGCVIPLACRRTQPACEYCYDPDASFNETGPIALQEMPLRCFCPTRSNAVHTSRETLERIPQPPAAYDWSQVRGGPEQLSLARRSTCRLRG